MAITRSLALIGALALASCQHNGSAIPTPDELRAEAEESINPTLEEDLACVGSNMPRLSVTVAKIPDLTGKVTISDGGDGAYVSQGARYIAMAHLERMQNVTVINTADFDVERVVGSRVGAAAKWPTAPLTYVSGAITRIDFVPGTAIEGGVGPVQVGGRQFGVVIGADLFLTRYSDSRVLESASTEISLKGDQLKLAIADMLGSKFATAGVDARRRAALQIGTETLIKAGLLDLFKTLAKACEISTEGN